MQMMKQEKQEPTDNHEAAKATAQANALAMIKFDKRSFGGPEYWCELEKINKMLREESDLVAELRYEIEAELEEQEQQRAEQAEYDAELAYQAEYRIDALTQLYLVERSCGGDNAMGGGCGAWYVTTIREARPSDRMVCRASPDCQRDASHRIVANWHRADGYAAIDGGDRVCSGCRRVEW